MNFHLLTVKKHYQGLLKHVVEPTTHQIVKHTFVLLPSLRQLVSLWQDVFLIFERGLYECGLLELGCRCLFRLFFYGCVRSILLVTRLVRVEGIVSSL